MKTLKLLLALVAATLLLVSCGGEVREFEIKNVTTSKQGQQVYWDVEVAVYDPAVRNIGAELLVGSRRIQAEQKGFPVPTDFLPRSPTAVFRFPVPRENLPGARIQLWGSGVQEILPVG